MYSKITLVLVCASLALGVSVEVKSDTTFDSDIQSKVARYKAKKKLAWSRLSSEERALRIRQQEFSGFDSRPGLTPCGAIDLGNVPNASASSGSRSVTVIIDGDVINADNHCR